ncbi:hypothetical protein [Mycobacterium innocens]|nr:MULTISPECIES: hypothetical protein [Mycobacterium]
MDGKLRYEQLDGKVHHLNFDFVMLPPPFKGASLAAYDRGGHDRSTGVPANIRWRAPLFSC